MVEANPQPQDTPGNNDDSDASIETIEREYVKMAKTVNQKLEVLVQFKQEISVDLVDLCQRADAIRDKFRRFAENAENMIEDVPLLCKGAEHYAPLLEIQAKAILEGLEDDILRWKVSFKVMETEKQQRIKNVQELKKLLELELKSSVALFKSFKPHYKATKRLDLAASAKTLRKLDCFGKKNNAVDFEWPKPEDVLKFPEDKLIKLSGLVWKCDATTCLE